MGPTGLTPRSKASCGGGSGARPRLSLPLCCHRYRGHVPGVATSCGYTYGTTTFKYFQDCRHAAMEKSHHTCLSRGGQFPTIFSPEPSLMQSHCFRWLRTPTYTRFNLDNDRALSLTRFYQVGWARGGSPPQSPGLPSPRGSGDSCPDSPSPPPMGELEPLGMCPSRLCPVASQPSRPLLTSVLSKRLNIHLQAEPRMHKGPTKCPLRFSPKPALDCTCPPGARCPPDTSCSTGL